MPCSYLPTQHLLRGHQQKPKNCKYKEILPAIISKGEKKRVINKRRGKEDRKKERNKCSIEVGKRENRNRMKEHV